MYCRNCGQELVDGMDKCPFCNTPTGEKKKNIIHTVPRNRNTGSGCSILLAVIWSLSLVLIGTKTFLGELDSINFNTENFLSEFGDTFNSNPNDINDSVLFSFDNSSENINNYSKNIIPEIETYNINVKKIANEDNAFPNAPHEYALTVLNYKTESYNAMVGEVETGQEWIIVEMKFENMSNSAVIINKNDFKIVDGAERYGYRPYYKHLDSELEMIEVKAGQTATFSTRFVYYKNYDMSLRYYNSDFSPLGYTTIKLR